MQESGLHELIGTIVSVIYRNDENGYSVLRLQTEEDIHTVVGCIPFAAPGEELQVSGVWTRHPTHGEQLKAEWVSRTLPQSGDDIYEYLASGVIRGIGPATATLIITAFGEESLNVMESQPELLATIRGISAQKAKQISESFRKQLGIRMLMEFLARYELSMPLAMRMYKFYGDEALDYIQHNPYILASEYIGANFAEADKLALSLGFGGDSPERIAAAVVFELRHNLGNGHCFIPRDKLTAATAQLIGVDRDLVEIRLDALIENGEVRVEPIAKIEACYLARVWEAEQYVSERIRAMVPVRLSDDLDISTEIAAIELSEGFSYAPMQLHTLEIAAERRIMAITGGPGTGKTTSIRAILALFDRLGQNALLTAPTGRAAKRMSELTGRDALTVHRLLEAGFSEDLSEVAFKRGENDPLNCDAIILDECSMVDITLMRALLSAMPETCRLVLVGDADQLPSVGPGNVFNDIIRSGIVPVVRLTEVFRQKAESRIIACAHQINSGTHPNLNENAGDFFFLRRREAPSAVETIRELCSSRLPNNMGIPAMDIQVLTPTRRGDAGTGSLNVLLQQSLNPPSRDKREKQFGGVIFREGDRVMQIRNNYDIIWERSDGESGAGIYNGDIGRIVAIDNGEECLAIDFEDRQTVYGFDQLIELEHAYAMTVHKSQGSEYRAVVLSVSRGASALMTRSILYTAVTRAKELLILVGEPEIVHAMIDNNLRQRRYTGLRYKLLSDA